MIEILKGLLSRIIVFQNVPFLNSIFKNPSTSKFSLETLNLSSRTLQRSSFVASLIIQKLVPAPAHTEKKNRFSLSLSLSLSTYSCDYSGPRCKITLALAIIRFLVHYSCSRMAQCAASIAPLEKRTHIDNKKSERLEKRMKKN